MTLLECIQRIEEIKKSWPDGYNFTSKSKFLGFERNGVLLTIEQLESHDWGPEFESHDKEFNEGLDKFMKDFQ